MDLISQSFFIAAAISFAFGLLSFLSPCVLPIVPAYLAFMSGNSIEQLKNGDEKQKLVMTSIFFVLGLSVAFLIMALTFNRLATSVLIYKDIFTQIAGIVIIIFGFHFLGLFRFTFLTRELRVDFKRDDKSALSAFLLGLAFAIGWSPCLGPAISTILSMTASQDTLARAAGLAVFYVLGLGLPFIFVAMYIEKFMPKSARLNRFLPFIEKSMGLLLVFVGAFMAIGWFNQFALWLNESFPILQMFG